MDTKTVKTIMSANGVKQNSQAFVFVLFFMSGFSSLIYQIVWQRLLGYVYGVDVFSATITVAAYMMGIGSGSLAGGIIADRLTSKNLIALFAAAEVAIALFAVSSKYLIYDLLGSSSNALLNNGFGIAAVSFLILLIPTFCMGVTLPLLSKALTIDSKSAGHTIGSLYAVNTFGAAFGALATTLILIRNFGIPGSIGCGAAINILTAAGVLALLHRVPRDAHDAAGSDSLPQDVAHQQSKAIFPIPAWLCIYFLSGFIAIALEIVWFRVLGVMLKSNSFTFSWLLFVYLSGIAAGSSIGLLVAKRITRPTTTFLWLQAAIPIYSGLCPIILLNALERIPILSPGWKYLAGYWPMNIRSATHLTAQFDILYLGCSFFMVFIPCLIMGFNFTNLQSIVHTDLKRLGRRLGWLQFSNIFGATMGAMAVGFFFFSAVGTASTFKILIWLDLVFIALWWKVEFGPKSSLAKVFGFAGCAAVVLFTVLSLPSQELLWANLHGTDINHIITKEGASGLGVLRCANWTDDREHVFVMANGQGQSELPFGSDPIHTNLGLLPALLHPNPRDIAIIGLGSGDTVYGAAGRKETQSITCIELVEQEMETLKELQKRRLDESLNNLLSDPRIHFVYTDGRRFLNQPDKKYDILEADALLPHTAYSGNVYSREFFSLLREHLKPDGLAVSWSPTSRTRASFISSFPYIAEFADDLWVGSNQPIKVDKALILERTKEPFTQAHYQSAKIDAATFIKRELDGYKPTSSRETFRADQTNSDLFPRDEYQTYAGPLTLKSFFHM
jgi:spermidine synthase